MVSEHPSGKGLMYLVFKDNADDYLDSYEMRLHATAVVLALSDAQQLVTTTFANACTGSLT